jgi:hypothetical protein
MAKGISVALVMLLLTTITALAAPPSKIVETHILPATAQTLTVSQTLNIEAKTLKHGSSYTDAWQGATKVATVLNKETGVYESIATFTATEPGTFTIIYTITMTVGRSHISFVGTGAVTVEVVAPVQRTFSRFELRGQWSGAFINPGVNEFRTYTGAVWAIWFNGEELVQSICETIRTNHTRGGFDVAGRPWMRAPYVSSLSLFPFPNV